MVLNIHSCTDPVRPSPIAPTTSFLHWKHCCPPEEVCWLMEHAQLEVSWLHPPEAQLVQDPALYTTHLVVSIHYTIHYTWWSLYITQYTTLGGLYTLHNTLHLVVSIHYTIHYTWWSLYTTQYTTPDGLYTLHYTIHYTWWSLFTLCVVLSCARNPLQASGDCTVGLCGLACVVGWLGARGCL